MPITTAPVRAMSNVAVAYGVGAAGVVGGAGDITGACDSAQLAATINEIETTTLASTGKETTPGQSEYKIDCSGPWSLALDAIIGIDAVTPPGTKRACQITFGPSTNKVIYTWTVAGNVGAYIANYTIDASNPSEAITWSGTLTLSGAPTRTTG